MFQFICRFGLYFAWLVALTATLSSLYASEVLAVEPCTLCWYQRICLFSLVITLAIAAYRRDINLHIYVVPQVTVGALIALYQTVGYWSSSLWTTSLCKSGWKCSEYLAEAGVTYPALSFGAFLLIGLFMICARRGKKIKGENP